MQPAATSTSTSAVTPMYWLKQISYKSPAAALITIPALLSAQAKEITTQQHSSRFAETPNTGSIPNTVVCSMKAAANIKPAYLYFI